MDAVWDIEAPGINDHAPSVLERWAADASRVLLEDLPVLPLLHEREIKADRPVEVNGNLVVKEGHAMAVPCVAMKGVEIKAVDLRPAKWKKGLKKGKAWKNVKSNSRKGKSGAKPKGGTNHQNQY